MARASTRISARRGGGHEWLVGVVAMPRLLSGQTATALLVYELPSHLVIAIDAVDDARPAAIIGVVETALRRRAVDGLAMPARVRTANRSVVDALSQQSMVPVVHAPTPELAPAIRSLLEHLDRATTRRSLEEFVPLDHPALFGAAANLYRAAPWETLENDDLLVIDCPALGLNDAVVSTMGHEKEQFGFLLFDDEDDYEQFLDMAEEVAEGRQGRKRRRKLAYLALDFTPRSELSPKLAKALRSREVALAAPDAIPLAYRIIGGVDMQPADDDVVRTLTIVTEAMAAFWRKHGASLRASRAEKTLTIEVSDVTIAVSGPLYGVDGDLPRRHFDVLLPLPVVPPGSLSATARLHHMRMRLAASLLAFGKARLGEDFLDEPGRIFGDGAEADHVLVPLLVAIATHHFRWQELEGRTVSETYLADADVGELEQEERDSIEAERRAWISLWQVREVVPGESLALLDLLSGQRRTVVERTASRSLEVGMVVLASVVDYAESSQIVGMYGRALSLRVGKQAATQLRKQIGSGKKAIATGRLLEPDSMVSLLRRFLEAMDELRGAR